jgi:hypothetical protein
LLLRKQRSGRSRFEVSPDKQFLRPYLKNAHHTQREKKTGLVEWLKEALSSNPSTERKKRKKERKENMYTESKE